MYVKGLGVFLTLKVLYNTPAVLSLGKLCDENGFSKEWINGQKPHHIGERNSDYLQHRELRSYCGSRRVKFFLGIFINFTDTYETGESFFFIFFILIFITYSRRYSGSRREDALDRDISPVPVSNLVDDGSGQPEQIQANEIPKTNKKETTIERGNPCNDSEIPEWLQEFRENLVDDEIPLQGCSHASSSHEDSLEPTFKRREDLGKHSVRTHFPKNRNCDICQRTKITRAPCRRRNGEAVHCAKKFW